MRRTLVLSGLLGACLLAGAQTQALAGDAEAGKAAFAKCGICHQVGPDAKNLVGPPLNNIVGANAAAVEGYDIYSPGLKKLGEEGYVWTEENLDGWIEDPKALLPNSTMSLAFQGIPDADERANIIAYLKTFSN